MIDLRLGNSMELARDLPDQSVNTIVTSPPYWGLRDYGVDGQLGLERTPEEYVCHLVELFRELRRVLRDDGTLWLNLGDSYSGSGKGDGGDSRKQTTNRGSQFKSDLQGIVPSGTKPKDLVGIPWRVAFALQADGWYLRSDIIWHKPNPMPESVTDRPTKSHEYIFLLSKQSSYYYDADAVREPYLESSAERYKYKFEGSTSPGRHKPENKDLRYLEKVSHGQNVNGRNRRSVWTVTTKPFREAHFATFPPDLIRPCILAGCPVGGTVLDPFNGAGTTGVVAVQEGRNYIGLELNPAYLEMSRRRIEQVQPALLPA